MPHLEKGLEFTAIKQSHIHVSTHHPSQEIWNPLSLLKACIPYYEHFGVRQHEQQQNPLNVGPFMPEPVYILVSVLRTIQA
jgi:hypothetical protein